MEKLRLVLKEFSALPKKSKLGVVFLLLFIFIISFWVTISYRRLTTPQVRKPISKAKQAPLVEEVKEPILASLSLAPEKRTIKQGDKFLVTLNLDTADFKVDAVDVVLNFDPQILAVEKVSGGMFFADYPVKKWENNQIFLTGTIGAEDKQTGGAKGEGAVGSITFKAQTAGTTNVSFDNSSLVVKEGENVLGETKGAIFEISNF